MAARGRTRTLAVDAFIEALADPDKQVVLDNQIERLNMLRSNDPPLPFPWSS